MRSPWGAGAPDKAQSSAELIERRKSPLIFVRISLPPPPHPHRHGQSGGQHSTGQASGKGWTNSEAARADPSQDPLC